MERLTASLNELSEGISHRLSNILTPSARRRSRESSESPSSSHSLSPDDPDEAPPEYGVDFEVEEEQVMKGLELLYHDKLNEADEYFETLKSGHARFSLHHAEVASYFALMTFEPEDVDFAIALLKETAALAAEQGRRWRTHSKLKQVATAAQETVGAMTNWARKSAVSALSLAGPAGAQAIAKIMPVENPDFPDDDDDAAFGSVKDPPHADKRAEVSANHRARRMRLWALLIQGECHLMTSLLQIVAAGESWTEVVKVGYNVKRTWSIYQHCQNKLKHVQNEWTALGGTFTGVGELAEMNVDYNDSDNDADLDKLGPGEASSSSTHLIQTRKSQLQNYDPILAAPQDDMVYQGVRAAASNMEMVSDGVREDQELASLRIGVQFGVGAFNLLISLIPTSYQKAIELIGVPAERTNGLALLKKISGLHHCRAPLAAILLLQYYTLIMGLLPYTEEENTIGAKSVLNMLPIAWGESSVFRFFETRLVSYQGRLRESSSLLDKMVSATTKAAQDGGLLLKMQRLLLGELGWTLFLQGDFVNAKDKFGELYKKADYFKPFFAFLQSACCWEADDKYHKEAASLLQDIPMMVARKTSTPTAVEQFAIRIADEFIKHGQVPLFPGLETIAVYNGFHHMDKDTLRRHMDRVGDAFMMRCPKRAAEYADAFSADLPHRPHGIPPAGPPEHPASSTAALNPGDPMTGLRKIAFRSKSKVVPQPEEEDDDTTPVLSETSTSIGDRTEHRWTKESKILCRYLLALCQRSLGDIKQAEANFRFVVSQTDVPPGNVIPYACFEWGSLLLDNESTSPEGLNLLEKSIQFPPHEFQSRLRFVVGERLRMFRRECETDLSIQATMTSALNLRRVSELLRNTAVKERPL